MHNIPASGDFVLEMTICADTDTDTDTDTDNIIY